MAQPFTDETYAACKLFIKNVNWFLQRKQQYVIANYNTWGNKNAAVLDLFKVNIDNFAFAKNRSYD